MNEKLESYINLYRSINYKHRYMEMKLVKRDKKST